ncbi:hypothetical protein A2690_00865 [Candidatus Roizmanbacteria bacterium RIFCSPHIGHO2_01_FULL_39_12b]|uniref:Peptidase A2 domain-containing protein n=1 Tax=Candidatus Roizmanbacteria bacterium RIFCSPHIGHO2_01_FULL_39_12b TaxID=1802030 RepID=A0A1F7GAS3_9BACT|nr:MAG: hypothetical protein A2690_00865 [Candidatus Roizmanbacteria bacterium RIFCSPHIGHO2_01_FULL_39_12b]
MDVKFPFESVGSCFFGKVYRPIVKVSFLSPKTNLYITTWLIVDSGADFTILPQYLSDDLGISFEHDCVVDETHGVGGRQTLYLLRQRIKVKIGRFERMIPLAFLDSNEVPPLMGRLGFIETFETLFSKKHTVVFKE